MLLALLFSLNAWALPLGAWQSATVKVESYPCLTKLPRFEGTGLLVSRGTESYVITSEHVVIQSASPSVCHEANRQPLELVSADFFAGLALLHVKGNAAGAIPLASLTPSGSTGSLTALGFPSGASDLVTLTGGNLLSRQSRRALIAGQPALIEAGALPVEFGMSGGPLLIGEDWLGLLSHQVLRREAGHATKPGDLAPGPGNENDIAIAIPAAAVLEWVDRQLKSPAAVWTRDPEAQIRGEEALRFGPLLLTLRHAKAKDIWDIGGLDHGGGDGAGIGGGEEGEPEPEELPYLDLSFRPDATPSDKAAPLANPTLDRWREWLLTGKKVRAVFLRDPREPRLLRVQNPSQFLTYWMRDGFTPVALRSRDENLHSEGEILLHDARAVESLAQEARDAATAPEQKAWFGLLRDRAVLAENGLASSAEVAALLEGENEPFWRAYYVAHFDEAVALETAFQQLLSQMRKMGL